MKSPTLVLMILLAIILMLLTGCVTTAAQIGTGIVAGSSPTATVTHH